MKKILVAFFAFIIMPALILLLIDFNVRRNMDGNGAAVPLEENVPEYIVGKPESLLCSPLQNVSMETGQDENGAVYFTVSDASGLLLLDRSYIGITTDECDFSGGLSFVRQKPAAITDKKYSNISGKKKTTRNYYNETVFTYEKSDFYFDVYLRAYEDGFAYRFGIRSKESTQTQLSVIAETGSYSVPSKSVMTAELINNVRNKFCYETTYSKKSVEWLSINKSKYVCFPALAAIADRDGTPSGKYLLLSEADMVSCPYHGSVLKAQGKNVFSLHPAPVVSDSPTVITTDFLSPWRFGIYGEAGDIAVSDMADNLAQEPQGDYSWVKPGVTAWTWLSEKRMGQNNPNIIKKYIPESVKFKRSRIAA